MGIFICIAHDPIPIHRVCNELQEQTKNAFAVQNEEKERIGAQSCQQT
jgi:hypothetical protein